jgi:hypothetical protein
MVYILSELADKALLAKPFGRRSGKSNDEAVLYRVKWWQELCVARGCAGQCTTGLVVV